MGGNWGTRYFLVGQSNDDSIRSLFLSVKRSEVVFVAIYNAIGLVGFSVMDYLWQMISIGESHCHVVAAVQSLAHLLPVGVWIFNIRLSNARAGISVMVVLSHGVCVVLGVIIESYIWVSLNDGFVDMGVNVRQNVQSNAEMVVVSCRHSLRVIDLFVELNREVVGVLQESQGLFQAV